jgi:serine/threonine-protein kinase
MRFTGSPRSLAESVERAPAAGAVYFDVSATGLLVYAPTGERHQLVWVTRQGVETPISDDRAAFRLPRISPDGTRVAVCVNDERRNSHVWVYDTQRGTKALVTTTGQGLAAVWTPDGKRLTFSGGGIAEVAAEGGGAREILKPADVIRYPHDWSPDGGSLLVNVNDAQTGADVWAFSRHTKEVRPILVRPFRDTNAVYSPDGKWIAYESDESGQTQVYVASYPEFTGRVAISTAGGRFPIWARNGRELYYRRGDALMAVDIDMSAGLRVSRARPLFAGS